ARDEVGVKRRLLSPRGNGFQGLVGDREHVADAAGLDHDMVGAADEDLAADRGDHPARACGRSPAAPIGTFAPGAPAAGPAPAWLAWQIATASASAVWSECGGSGRPRIDPTMRWTWSLAAAPAPHTAIFTAWGV